jgi:hypothetical protein
MVWLVVITVFLHGCKSFTLKVCVNVMVRSARENPTTKFTVYVPARL